jgi:hypothetical protein
MTASRLLEPANQREKRNPDMQFSSVWVELLGAYCLSG